MGSVFIIFIISHARSGMSRVFGTFFLLLFLFLLFFFCVSRFCMQMYARILIEFHCTKMAAVLGMCLLFKTVVSSYRSNNTHLTYLKWKEKALKNTQKLL